MPILIVHRETDPASGASSWLRWASGRGFTSTPACDPPHTVWRPRVIEGGNYERHAVGPGQSRGRSKFAAGEVILNNADRGLSYLRYRVLTGQPIEIWRGPRSAAMFPADFELFLAGVVVRSRWERRRLVLELADLLAGYGELPLVTRTFAGNNALPAGLEGTPDDVGGKFLSQPYGVVRNVTLSSVNTEAIIHQVAARAIRTVALTAVEDGGSPYGAGSDYADLATLESTPPAATDYRLYPGTTALPAYVRLGAEPELGVTADVVEGASDAERTTGQVLKRMLQDLGLASGGIEGVEALDTRNPDVVGWWSGPEGGRGAEAIDAIAGGAGVWCVGSRLGTIAIGRLEAPKAIPDRVLEADDVIGPVETLPTEDDEPVGQLTLEWQANWTVQAEGDLAEVATVDLAERAWRAKAFRTLTSRDEAIFAAWPRARTVTWRSWFDTEAAAARELARLARLYSVARPTHRIRVAAEKALGLDFGLTLGVRHPDLGQANGVRAVLTGEIVTLSRNRVTLCLWGAEPWI